MVLLNSSIGAMRSSQRIFVRTILAFSLFMLSTVSYAQDLPSIEDTVATSRRMDGYFNLYGEESTGKM